MLALALAAGDHLDTILFAEPDPDTRIVPKLVAIFEGQPRYGFSQNGSDLGLTHSRFDPGQSRVAACHTGGQKQEGKHRQGAFHVMLRWLGAGILTRFALPAQRGSRSKKPDFTL